MGITARGPAQAVRDFIGRYDLHLPGALPVPIIHAARSSGWIVVYSPNLWPAFGLAVRNQTHRVMRIAEELSPCWQRYVVAHELGHLLAQHSDQLHRCDDPHQLVAERPEQEREADRIAAHLLIPDWLLREEASPAVIAERATVPESLVELRLGNIDAWEGKGL